MNILRESSTTDDEKIILDRLQNIIFEYEGTQLFTELRTYILEDIDNQSLRDTLLPLIDECETDNEDPEMILSILESELDSFFFKFGM